MSNRLKKQELGQALGLVGLTAGDFLKKTSLKPHGGVASRAPYYAKATLERVLGRIANGEIEALYPVSLLAPQSPIQSAVLLHLMAACGKPVMKLNGWTVVSKDDWAELESGLQRLAAGSPDAGAPTCNKVLATLGRYCRPLKAHAVSVDDVIVTLAGQGFAIKPRLFVEACSIYPLNVGEFVGMGGEVAQACSSGQAQPAVMANFEVTSDVAAPCRLSEDNQKAQKGAQRQASKPSIWNKFFRKEEK